MPQNQKFEINYSYFHQAGIAVILIALWIGSYRAANFFTIDGHVVSVWFMPAGVTLAILLAAPGWLKATPFIANLLLALPPLRGLFDLPPIEPQTVIVHALRFHLIYALTTWVFVRPRGIALPFMTLPDLLRFVGICIVAATLGTMAASGTHIFAEGALSAGNFRTAAAWWLGDVMGALSLPPLLVPLLLKLMGRPLGDWQWPGPLIWIMQALIIGGAALGGALSPGLGINLWFGIMPPVIVFALYGGFRQAASGVFLTCLLPLVTAALLVENSELFTLAPLIPTTMVAGLLIGAAIHDRQQVAQELERQVARRTGELEKAYQLQRHLVRSLGHDLRQPMEAINLTLDGLAGTIRDEPALKALGRARDLGAAASDLLSRILLYARLDVGDIQPQLTSFPLSELMDRLRRLYGPPAKWREVELSWDFPERTIRSDRELLFQAMANFIDNAIRLSMPGSAIGISVRESENGLHLLVEDDIDQPLPRRSSPGGLGLRIVRQIAALLDAEVIDEPNRKGIHLQRGS